jgi:hypothetical protein
MAYPCDLPATTGTNDLLRAIYAKLGNINPSTGKIEEQLDTIIQKVGDVNANIILNTDAIEANTEAIKDISINIDIDSKDIRSIATAINKQTESIDKQTEVIKDISINVDVDTDGIVGSIDNLSDNMVNSIWFNTRAIQSLNCHHHCCPPRPCPPPHPHPHPCPEPVTPCDKIIPSYREGQRCKECEKQNQITEGLSTNYDKHYGRCYEPKTLEGLYEAYYHCYYPTFDDFFQALYGAQEDYYSFRDRYYIERYGQQYNENYDYYA